MISAIDIYDYYTIRTFCRILLGCIYAARLTFARILISAIPFVQTSYIMFRYLQIARQNDSEVHYSRLPLMIMTRPINLQLLVGTLSIFRSHERMTISIIGETYKWHGEHMVKNMVLRQVIK
jgi:hypothetical protein